VRLILVQNQAVWLNAAASLRAVEDLLQPYVKENDQSLTEKTCVVLPEMFASGFVVDLSDSSTRDQLSLDQDTVLQWMKDFSTREGIWIAGSIPYENRGTWTNRLILVGNGSVYGYDKRHLFALAGENEWYKAGTERQMVDLDGWKVLLSVCYDLRFPVWLRQKGDYQCLFCVANWPQARATAWRALLVARAIENQCYVVGVNRVGHDFYGIYYAGGSMVVGPDGAVLLEMNELEGVGTCTIEADWLQKYRRAYPFWKDADAFTF
jgi:predicted amidohydrolase